MRQSLKAIIAISALLPFYSVRAAEPSVGAYLANPTVRLWYGETGRLSENIAPPIKFTLWNTIIGEGDAEEHANDALFTIDIRSAGEQNAAQPLKMAVTDKRGKILASRIINNILTGEKGNATIALWVRDVGCAGPVTFTAIMGASKRSTHLEFDCGE
jgi:hypothetical protein